MWSRHTGSHGCGTSSGTFNVADEMVMFGKR
jgi:hypothetical protein